MDDKKPIVMVIEDEELLLQAITKKLQISNLEVISCTSGKQALEYLRDLSKLPNAIWLDYYLRDMNGLEFMHQLKTDEKLNKIPVVVVSNSASEEKVHSMLTLGAKEYVLKSEYRLDDIINIVRKFVKDEVN